MTLPEDINTVQAEVRRAEADLARAREREDWAQDMRKKGYYSPADYEYERQASQQTLIQGVVSSRRRRCTKASRQRLAAA